MAPKGRPSGSGRDRQAWAEILPRAVDETNEAPVPHAVQRQRIAEAARAAKKAKTMRNSDSQLALLENSKRGTQLKPWFDKAALQTMPSTSDHPMGSIAFRRQPSTVVAPLAGRMASRRG